MGPDATIDPSSLHNLAPTPADEPAPAIEPSSVVEPSPETGSIQDDAAVAGVSLAASACDDDPLSTVMGLLGTTEPFAGKSTGASRTRFRPARSHARGGLGEVFVAIDFK